MTQDEQHLSIQQVEALLKAQRGEAGVTGSLTGRDAASHHLENCGQCQKMVAMYRDSEPFFEALRQSGKGDKTPDCPSQTQVLELAAGVTSERESKELLSHVTQCDFCGPLFRRARTDFSAELSDDEKLRIAKLESAKPEWQQKLVREMNTLTNATSPSARLESELGKGRYVKWVPAFVGLAAAVCIAVWAGFYWFGASNVSRLLARAYTENRTMDLRYPGAKYARIRQERGASDSAIDRPQALLDANALIARELKTHPNDPTWLQAKGRADLLEFRYEPALAAFQKALTSRPDSADLEMDLAAAYFQRAEANPDRKIDYGFAVQHLSVALQKRKDDPVALFNRAVIEDKLQLYDPAIQDWQQYLRVDPFGPWAEEARTRLQEVQKKKESKLASLNQPLLNTHAVAALGSKVESIRELDGRVEDYLHSAVTEWLPEAYAASVVTKQVREANATLLQLGEILKDKHGDRWLADLLLEPHRTSFAAAVKALALAVVANDNGDYAAGRKSARRAVAHFHSSGNAAGELRARAEEVYSAHLLYQGNECVRLVRDTKAKLTGLSYAWLNAETSLEAANCDDLVGNLGLAREEIDLGTKLAEAHGYPSLFLRGLGFQADAEGFFGNAQLGFSLACRGLRVFWTTKVDLMKGYNLYADLDTAADVVRLPNLQVALWHQATDLIDLHSDVVLRAMAHRWFANSAYLANMPDLAAEEFGKASTLFGSAPRTPATERGRLDADIWLAGLEIRKGELSKASSVLDRVGDALAKSPSFQPEIGYYSARAELSLQEQNAEAVESALRSAIYLSEEALKSLPSSDARREWAVQSDHAYRNLVAWRLREGKQTEALEFWEWYKGAALRIPFRKVATKRDDEVQDVRKAPLLRPPAVVRTRLPELQNVTIVTYAVFPRQTSVWVYDDRGVFQAWIDEPIEELRTRAVQFKALCSTPTSDLGVLRSNAKALYEVLIGPIERRLVPGRTLVFELDEVLAPLPMEVLIDKDGLYLAQRGAVIVASAGLYETLHLRQRKPITRDSRTLVVSVAAPAEQGVIPLANAGVEAQAVADNFRRVLLLQGSEATTKVIRHEISNASVFHFTGHAVALPGRKGLLLAEYDHQAGRARLIDAHTFGETEIANLQLAVLSSCRTGGEGAGDGSGNESLVEMLLRSGVPHVIAARWEADSGGAAFFMRQFYSALMAGNSVPMSVHAAQLGMLARTTSVHPFYWAAFGVQGFFA